MVLLSSSGWCISFDHGIDQPGGIVTYNITLNKLSLAGLYRFQHWLPFLCDLTKSYICSGLSGL